MTARRIVFMGMAGEFSLIPLKSLIEAGAEVAAVVFPRLTRDEDPPRWLPIPALRSNDPQLEIMPTNPNMLSLASGQGIPVLEVGSIKNASSIQVIAELKPDLVIVACFPQIFPKSMLQIPTLGCLNIHPSLLPAYRGPDPFFWQFRDAQKDMGVSVHWMDAGADTGDILQQSRIDFPEGVNAREADRMAAQTGAKLILAALRNDEWPRQPQRQHAASYQHAPGEADKVIPAGWSVQRAFGFIRGADVWAPFWIEMADGEQVKVRQAMGYELGLMLKQPVEKRDGETWLQMSDGALRVG